MAKKKQIFKVLWVLIAVIVVAAITSLIVFPYWKGIFFAGAGGFLILNLLIAMFFIKKNYPDRE